MRLVAISDTHGVHRRVNLPAGDVLVHSGDLTLDGEGPVTLDFVDWFSEQPFEHKIFVAGNHDAWAENNSNYLRQYAMDKGVHYLQNSSVVIDDVTFWGSPFTPRFMDWSFMLSSTVEASRHWKTMPDSVDVLVTHGPPFGILDTLLAKNSSLDAANTDRPGKSSPDREHVGCNELFNRVREVSPQLHLFGHIHEAFGEIEKWGTRFINTSSMNSDYQLTNQPRVIDLTKNTREASVAARNNNKTSANESSFDRPSIALDV